ILPRLAPKEGFVFEETVIGNAAKLHLPGTWQTYLDSLDGHERKELRRKIRKAHEQAGAKLLICDHTGTSVQQLEQAMALIEAADQSKSQWLRSNVRPLLGRIGLALLNQKRMRLLILMLNDAPAACLIDFPSSRGPLLYNSGFDPTQRQWS